MVVRHNLASVYARRGSWDLAEPIQRRSWRAAPCYGEDSDLTARTLESLTR